MPRFLLLLIFFFAILPCFSFATKVTYAPAVKKTAPAVVNIYATDHSQKHNPNLLYNDPIFQSLPDDDKNSLGSGVVVHEQGIVVTSAHVIDGTKNIKIVFTDKREFDAELIAIDRTIDMALLRILNPNGRLPFIVLANSDTIAVGDIAIAIGNPFGIGQTVTSGIISAVARPHIAISDLGLYIQTDAAINPGNSGGALIDSTGALIGINAAIFSKTGGSLGIGFAVPSNMVRVFVERALRGEKVRKFWMGMSGMAVDNDIAKKYAMKKPMGVLITRVYPSGPAYKAGIAADDILLSIDGHDIPDMAALSFMIATGNAGEQKTIVLLRNGKPFQTQASLEQPPEIPARRMVSATGNNALKGVDFVNFSPAVAYEIGADYFNQGVMIYAIGQKLPAYRLGIRQGDFIRKIDGVAITDTDQIKELLSVSKTSWRIEFERSGKPYYLDIGK